MPNIRMLASEQRHWHVITNRYNHRLRSNNGNKLNTSSTSSPTQGSASLSKGFFRPVHHHRRGLDSKDHSGRPLGLRIKERLGLVGLATSDTPSIKISRAAGTAVLQLIHVVNARKSSISAYKMVDVLHLAIRAAMGFRCQQSAANRGK